MESMNVAEELINMRTDVDVEFSYIQNPQGANPQTPQSVVKTIQEEEPYDNKEDEYYKREFFIDGAFNQYLRKIREGEGRTQKLSMMIQKFVKQFQEFKEKEREGKARMTQDMRLYYKDENSTNFCPDDIRPHHQNENVQRLNEKRTKEQYPTKNMLPSFKTSFIRYLSAFFSSKIFNEFGIIKRIRNKDGINLKDYEDLFNEPAFRRHLKRYFRNKQIYRDLYQSRISYEKKLIYFAKLPIFEEAFNSGVFKRIN